MENIDHAKWGKYMAIRRGDPQHWHMNIFFEDEEGIVQSWLYSGGGLPEQKHKLAGHGAPADLEWKPGLPLAE